MGIATSVGEMVGARFQEARESREQVLLVGGGVEHARQKLSGEATVRSCRTGLAWVSKEVVTLESQTAGAGAAWQALGKPGLAKAEGATSQWELSDADAACDVTYQGAPDWPHLKASFRLRASKAGSYRIRWSLQGLRGHPVPEALAQGLHLEEEGEQFEVDWSDVATAHPDKVAVETNQQGVEIVFGPFALAAGEEIILDPTVASIYNLEGVEYPSGRRLVRTSDRTLYMAYVNTNASGSPRVYMKSSSDGGQTWSAATMVSADYECAYSALVSDSRDDLHVVYTGYGAGYTSYYQVWHAWRKEGVWQTPVRLSTTAGMESNGQYVPALAVDAADDLQAVWYGVATGYSHAQVWWAKCQQRNWQAPVRLSTTSGMDSYDQGYPTVATDGNLGVQVAWQGMATGYTSAIQIWFAEYVNGAWGSPVRLSTYSGMDSNGQSLPCLALSPDGHVHVTWGGTATGYTSYAQSWYAERTSSWQTPVRISTGTGMDTAAQGSSPMLAVDAGGQLHAVWGGNDATHTNQLFAAVRNSAGSWGTPSALTTTSWSRIPNLRWAPFHNRDGSLDWVYVQGETVLYYTGGDSDQSATSVNRKSQSFKALEFAHFELCEALPQE